MIKKSRIAIQVIFLGIFVYLMSQGAYEKWLIIFLISLPVALLLGRVFCGWICPINTLMTPISFFAKKFNYKRKEAPTWLKSGVGKLAMILVLILVLILLLAFRQLFGIHLNMVIILTITGVLVTLWFKPEVWHYYLCPFGFLESLMGRFARFSHRVDDSLCSGCSLCLKVCPTLSVNINPETKKAHIECKSCLQCFECQERCPNDAITYSLNS